jgi:hypothetical protein
MPDRHPNPDQPGCFAILEKLRSRTRTVRLFCISRGSLRGGSISSSVYAVVV